jgi:diguanylate cyclase (GGDEF)-like protein
MKAVDGISSHYFQTITIVPDEGLFDNVIKANRPLIVDKRMAFPKELNEYFYEKFKLKNTLAIPVYLRGKVIAILGIGNNKEKFSYKNDDVELLDIFAKQIAISMENDLLLHQVEKLEIKDSLTGLYNESFIVKRLQEEIRRSIVYQRPCGFILLNVDNFAKFQQKFGSLQAESMLKRIAALIRDSVSEIDRVGRMGDDEFAVVLPEKSKRKAQDIAEEVRKKIAFSFGEEQDPDKRLTVSGGVSENPLDGINAKELIAKAKASVNLAKIQGKNRILG